MNSFHIISLIGALVFTSIGQFFFKYYFKNRKLLSLIIAIFSFLAIPVLSYLALGGISLDKVYMATVISILLTMVLAYKFLDEKITKNQIIGTVFIFLGIVVYNL